VDKKQGTMDGYHISNDEEKPSSSGFQTSHLWRVKFPEGTEKVLQVIPKPSQGRWAWLAWGTRREGGC